MFFNAIKKRNLLKVSGLIACTVGLSGCFSHRPMVPDDIKQVYSSNLPKGVLTNFNEAMACMDNLLLVENAFPIYISSEGLKNYTSDRTISSGGKEMLITSLSRIATRSNAVKFISYGSDMANMLSLQGAHPDKGDFRVPDYFIRGGVTQHNKQLWNGQKGFGFSGEISSPKMIDLGTFFSLHGQEDFTKSYSNSASYGTVTVDMSAGHIATLQNIPGVASANTLALESKEGESITGDLSISDLGFTYSFSDSMTYDFNTVFRSLVQVGVIEIVGKIQKVPYWRCLSNAGQVEKRDRKLLKNFITMKNKDEKILIEGVQTVLTDLNYFNGTIDGKLSESLKDAIQQYQTHMGIIASGDIDYETFRMMNLFTPTKDDPSQYWWQFFDGMPTNAKNAKT